MTDLHQAFKRHGVLAFDQPGMDRSTSVARTLRDVIYGDSVPRHVRAVLLKIAASAEGLAVPEERTAGEVPPVRRLTNLGLVATDTATGHVVANPLVRAFLIAEGELGAASSAAGTSRHVSSSKDQQQNPDVERAKAILRGATASLDEIEKLGDR